MFILSCNYRLVKIKCLYITGTIGSTPGPLVNWVIIVSAKTATRYSCHAQLDLVVIILASQPSSLHFFFKYNKFDLLLDIRTNKLAGFIYLQPDLTHSHPSDIITYPEHCAWRQPKSLFYCIYQRTVIATLHSY